MEAKLELELPVQTVRIDISCPDPVEIYHNGNLSIVLQPGTHRFTGTFALGNLDLKSKRKFAYSTRQTGKNAEHMDQERGVAARKRENNILAQLRNEFRRQLGVMREPFETDAPWPGHEIDDEVEAMFEEEEQQAAKEAREAEEQAAHEAEAGALVADQGAEPEPSAQRPAAETK